MSDILKRAREIVVDRAEEKDRRYGDFIQSMKNAAAVAGIMTGTTVTTEQAYAVLVGLKLAREGFHHKEDNLLDTLAYIGSLNDYQERKKEEQPPCQLKFMFPS